MKKVIAALAIFLAAFAYSEEQGVTVNVELVSGTKQRAQFLGIENDTVQLGGYIQNQFTVIRIHKDKFKSIKDESGKDLILDTLATNNTVAATDSANAVPDSTKADSAAAEPVLQTIPLYSPVVLVSYEMNSNDSIYQIPLTGLTTRLLTEEGETLEVVKRSTFTECHDDICVSNSLSASGANTIYLCKLMSGPKADSVTLELTRAIFKDSLPEMHKAQLTLSRASALSEAIKDNRLHKLIQKAKNIPVPEKKSSTSYIFIDSDPDGAMVSRPEKAAICRTPCTFAVTDTGKIELNAYWNVESQLWGAQSIVRPIPGDTAKIALKLKPISPEVHVITTPSDAEIFPGKETITKKSESIGTTPTKFLLTEPGMASITLRRIGYKDTVVSFYAAPVNEILLNVDMERLDNYDEIAKQEQWQHDRKMTKVGHAIMASAIAPVIASVLFFYLANKDYDEAKDIKDELNMPASVNGANYQKKIDKNKDLVDSGDRKMVIGASLAGAGVLMFGFGLFLSF